MPVVFAIWIIWILLFVILLSIAWSFYQRCRYSLMMKKQHLDRAFADVEVLLIQRRELLPGLITTTKDYLRFDQKALLDIARYRSRIAKAQGNDRMELENQITHAIDTVFVAATAYPDLKFNDQFLALQLRFQEVELQLVTARRAYNAALMNYNQAISLFPNSLIADYLGYHSREGLTAIDR